ncbi:hypothetical protein I6E68_05355 [Salinibacterium sp. NSLL150]|uniref:hypothetical protein n=1 Tax=unclassified Salinibacterium TaxID=2632331 RepID=UPI0018CD18AB|nr:MULTISPECIES: hypothetical protein [unclassified Salinibacterium]MBH0098568.1 hypothetical protein [Salinibacterium sp. NSLL35]MBH0101323.1 hypothetical protein [Salinibacterium sp. NSLL150]MBH0104082.1 hypothetical protein [Salinibacterium sp. NSLL16]MBH0106843.1 hypothetical protein [Salinibacterium sp. NSLL17]
MTFLSSARATPTTLLVSAAALFALALSGCTAAEPTADVTDDENASAAIDLDAVNDDTLFVLGTYDVDGDEILGDVPADQAAVWDRFNELFPAELHPEITMFVAIDVEQSGGTDGAMQPNGVREGETYLALDTTGGVDADVLDRTMIHEFAHLITLREDQIPQDESTVDACPVYSEIDGCPFDDSYLFAYYTEFWPDFSLDDLETETEDDKEERYTPEEFVTDYAATIPSEDAAEVFAEWVLADDLPAGDSIVEQKLRFFEDYPELVELRDTIREGLFS